MMGKAQWESLGVPLPKKIEYQKQHCILEGTSDITDTPDIKDTILFSLCDRRIMENDSRLS